MSVRSQIKRFAKAKHRKSVFISSGCCNFFKRLLLDSAPSIFFVCVHFRIPTAAYYLVYFEVDETVILVSASLVSEAELQVGDSCFVRVKGKLYKGSIVTYVEQLQIGVLKLLIFG